MKVSIIFEKLFILREQSEFLFYPVFQLKKRWNKGFPKIHDADKVREKEKELQIIRYSKARKREKRKKKTIKEREGQEENYNKY